METPIPSCLELRSKLASLSQSELEALAAKCNVPLPTLVKIRYGQTENPRLETVRAIWPELIGADGAPESPTAEAA